MFSSFKDYVTNLSGFGMWSGIDKKTSYPKGTVVLILSFLYIQVME
jgi:hypothetical protein